ncbi:MAG TPA: hypothetical protein VMV46_17615 [Thermoanaerobaculia bacterium]|nr:hypothetical protein [Thermoanaerobaculia bacterium]
MVPYDRARRAAVRRLRTGPALAGALLVVALVVGAHLPSAALAPSGLLHSRAQPDAAPARPPAWVADLDALRATFFGGPPIESVEDLFRVRLTLDGRTWTAPTHLFGDGPDGALRLVPYDNGDAATDVTGAPFGRGDRVIAELFPPGEIGFAVKHHRAAQRALDLPYRSTYLLREEIKLQDSHLQLVVGVERDGAPGAITLSAPQTYESGRFGARSYPMLFLRPVWPAWLAPEQVRAFRDNLRTMMVGFSSVSGFPSDYSGGDTMGASTPETVREHVAQMVRAIGGDEEALRWFREPEQRLYCAELGYLATNAGLLAPLNARTLVPMVGQEAWDAFVAQVELHRAGETSRFASLNDNRYIPLVELTAAPGDLRPAPEYAPRPLAPADTLAFPPQTVADLIRVYLRVVLPAMSEATVAVRPPMGSAAASADLEPGKPPRLPTGGTELAVLRAELVRSLRPGVVQLLALHGRPGDDPGRQPVEAIFERLAEAAGEQGLDDDELLAALEPLLDALGVHVRTLPSPAGALLAPPSLFHAVAQDLWPAGLLDLEPVGHGLHVSLLRPFV